MKIQNNVFEKIHDYDTPMSRQEKRERDDSWLKEVLDKTIFNFSNYALLTKVQYVPAILRTIIKTILVIYARHRLFLYLSCLTSLRSTYLSSYPHVLITFVYHRLCLDSNMV